MAQKRGIHPVTLGVVGGIGLAAAFALSHKKTREKIGERFTEFQEGIMARVGNGNGHSPMKMIHKYEPMKKAIKKRMKK